MNFAIRQSLIACTQDGSGWTPLMIASSLKNGDELVDMLLAKGSDVNAKSKFPLDHLRSYFRNSGYMLL